MRLSRRQSLGLLASSIISPAAVAGANPVMYTPSHAAASPPVVATFSPLLGLIERHRLAIIADKEAWNALADLEEKLEAISDRRLPRVVVTNTLSWDGNERVSTPTYAYSEDAIRKPILRHMECQLAMCGKNDELREQVRKNYISHLDAKLQDFRGQVERYERQEQEIGYTQQL